MNQSFFFVPTSTRHRGLPVRYYPPSLSWYFISGLFTTFMYMICMLFCEFELCVCIKYAWEWYADYSVLFHVDLLGVAGSKYSFFFFFPEDIK